MRQSLIESRRMPKRMIVRQSLLSLLLVSSVAAIVPANVSAQMTTGAKMPGYAEAFGLTASEQATDYTVQEIAVKAGTSTMANVLLPGEHVDLTYRFTNKTKQHIQAKGTLNLINYRTSVPPGDIWVPHVFKIGDAGTTPVEVDLPPSGFQDVTVHPEIPERFGGYVLIVDLPGHGRSFASAMVRSIEPDTGRVQYPTYALDATWPQYMNEGVLVLFEKLGVKGMRLGASYSPERSPEFSKIIQVLATHRQW